MARPSKDGERRTIRFDPQTDEFLQREVDRLGIDISSVLALILRGHFGLDGGPGGQRAHEAALRAADAASHLEAAFALLTEGQRPEHYKDRADAIQRLGAGPACEIWLALDALWAAREVAGGGR